jgi:hypothetical protein
MEVIHPSVSPSRRSCPSCGETLAGYPRFCPSCGTDVRSVAAIVPPERRLDPQATIGGPVVATAPPTAPPSSRPSKPWSLIVPLIAAGIVILLLAGWNFSVNGHLSNTRAALAGEKSRVTKLNERISSLNTQVSGLKSEKSDLQTQNSSLTSAMIDCREAASKTRGVFRLLNQISQGNASLDDLRAAGKEANRAWFVCRTEASTNGAI